MSTSQQQGLGRFLPVILAVIAAVIGIYLFQSIERKAEPQPAALGAPPASGITRKLSRGAMAAFLVKPARQPVPDFAFQDGSGKGMTIGAWRGRVVLVNLWATWCAPCRKEMPALAELQRRFGSKDFEVVAISVDRKGTEASGAFLKDTGAASLNLYVEPTARILNDLQALGLPATILIDRNGNEIGRLLGPAEWNGPDAAALIEAALGET